MDILIAVIFLTVVIYVTINICRGVKRLLVGKFPKGEKGSASAVAEVEYTPQPPKTTPHMEEDWKKKGREYMASWQK